MFNIHNTGAAALLGGTLLLGSASTALATPTLTTSAYISYGNDSSPGKPGLYHTDQVDDQASNAGLPVAANSTGSITGLNSGSSTQTMQVNATAKASAQYGVLKASSELTVKTPFYNPANADASVNPGGVPDFFSVGSDAALNDTLSLSAALPVSTLRLAFHLDGNLDSLYTDTLLSVINVYKANDYTQSYYLWLFPQAVDTIVNVDLAVSDPSAIDLALELTATSTMRLNIGGYDETQNYFASADFYNTLELTGVTAFDSGGNPVAIYGLSGDSGTNYLKVAGVNPSQPPQSGVPEPATLALIGAGLGGLSFMRRKRKA